MKMKKILNEWNKFLLNENQPFIDQQLGAPKGWFGKWDSRMGLLQTREWMQYIRSTYPDLKEQLEQEYTGKPSSKDKFVQTVISSIESGYSYYVLNYLGQKEFYNLLEKKLDEYFNSPSIPQDHKDFLKDNVDKIFDFGLKTMVPHETKVWHKDMQKPYSGKVAFFARSTDWYMFGEGFERTEQATKDYVAKL